MDIKRTGRNKPVENFNLQYYTQGDESQNESDYNQCSMPYINIRANSKNSILTHSSINQSQIQKTPREQILKLQQPQPQLQQQQQAQKIQNLVGNHNYKQILEDFLFYNNNNEGQQNIFQAIKFCLKRIEDLETDIRLQNKGQEVNKYITEFFEMQLKRQEMIYQQVVEQNLNLKQKVAELEQKVVSQNKNKNKFSVSLLINNLKNNKNNQTNNSKVGKFNQTVSTAFTGRGSTLNTQNEQKSKTQNQKEEKDNQIKMITNGLLNPNTQSSRHNTQNNIQKNGFKVLDLNNNEKIKKSQKSFHQQDSNNTDTIEGFISPSNSKTIQNNESINIIRMDSNQGSPSNSQQVRAHRIQPRNTFIQHATDFQFFILLLDMTASDDKIMSSFETLKFVQQMKEIYLKEDTFKEYLLSLDKESYQHLFETLQFIFNSLTTCLKIVLKLKKIIDGVKIMNSSLILTDAFETIVEQTCKILECDRASVFLVDRKRNELWTKVAKGLNTIKIPINSGIVGYVAQSGDVLNILDAHQDHRFNKEIDKKSNYRTKTILAVPIYEQNSEEILGVLEAINKNESFFTKDDEGITRILAQLAQVVLRNSIYFDAKLAFHNSLRMLLKVGQQINQIQSLCELISSSEQKLINNFDCSDAKIFLYDQKSDQLFRYDENNEKICFPTNIGIIGQSFLNSQILYIENGYQSLHFNSLVDINTLQPIFCFPIILKDTKQKYKIGIIQTVNSKGIEGLIIKSNQTTNTSNVFYDTLENFTQIIGQLALNIMNKENIGNTNESQL